MVRRAPDFDELADQVLAALAGRVFVAHNARFDWGFLGQELKRSRDVVLSGPRICTVRLARRLLRGQASCALDSLTDRFGLINEARHRAAGDALVTAELLRRFLLLAKSENLTTLADLERLCAARSGRSRRRRSTRH
jgi:DNA polymerase-3 subunit epsilon